MSTDASLLSPADATTAIPKTSSDRQRSRSFATSSTLSPNSGAATTHKRTSSGSLLARIPFLRSSSPTSPGPTSPSKPRSSFQLPGTARTSIEEQDEKEQEPPLPRAGGALASVLGGESPTKQRKRKGSLRKTAILGTNKLRRNSNAESPLKSPKSPEQPSKLKDSDTATTAQGDALTVHTGSNIRLFGDEISASPIASSALQPPRPPPPLGSLKLETASSSSSQTAQLLSPLTSPSGTYASTTDDDDNSSLTQYPIDKAALLPPLATPSSSPFPSPPSSEASLSLPSTRRRLSKLSQDVGKQAPVHSPLAPPHIMTTPSSPEDAAAPTVGWDYSETEWWGWVVLIVTWIVFVVGMGSCLEVWSWAWDVGETPYAPPELEDDPTLPIVGYYPALMVLTTVMGWVWVVAAWMGMKYFKHAKIQGEDT